MLEIEKLLFGLIENEVHRFPSFWCFAWNKNNWLKLVLIESDDNTVDVCAESYFSCWDVRRLRSGLSCWWRSWSHSSQECSHRCPCSKTHRSTSAATKHTHNDDVMRIRAYTQCLLVRQVFQVFCLRRFAHVCSAQLFHPHYKNKTNPRFTNHI